MSRGRSRITLSNALFDPAADGLHIRVGDAAWPVRVVRHAQSRRYRLIFEGAPAKVAAELAKWVK